MRKHGAKLLPFIDVKRCSGCKKCVEACPNNVLIIQCLKPNKRSFFRMEKQRAQLNSPQNCDGCGICVLVCRHKAILIRPSE